MVDAGAGESPCDPSRIILDSRPKGRSRTTALAHKAAHDCLQAVSTRIIDTKAIKSKTIKRQCLFLFFPARNVPAAGRSCLSHERRRRRCARICHTFTGPSAAMLRKNAPRLVRNRVGALTDASRAIPAMYTLACKVEEPSSAYRYFSLIICFAMALDIRTTLRRLRVNSTFTPPIRLAHRHRLSSRKHSPFRGYEACRAPQSRRRETRSNLALVNRVHWRPRPNPLIRHGPTPKTALVDGSLQGEVFREMRRRSHASPRRSRNRSPLACTAIPSEPRASRHPHPRAAATSLPPQIDGMRFDSFVAAGALARSSAAAARGAPEAKRARIAAFIASSMRSLLYGLRNSIAPASAW